ncbi:MAG TPA: glycoside hydrolase family 3 C-terminal domain-containing protein, partial [Pyrinomonadaceae bacterium]
EIQGLGKPVVLVLMGGSALAVNWANEHVGAILDAWYPGEEGGTAIADVLFGDYNPAGRLPVTFYKSVADLPPFNDYAMEGRTYRYFKGTPLYPFGFGLSYTTFKYGRLKFDRASITAGQSLNLSVEVTNTGSRAGDEVAQVYLTDVASSYPKPIRSLTGVKRINLKPGEKQVLEFTITPDQMAVVDDNGNKKVEPGEFLVSVGGKQPGFTGGADAATTSVVQATFSVK